MSLYDLRTEAHALPEAWHSHVLGRIGTANLKVVRMDERSVAEEVHEYDEGLLVINGQLELSVKGEKITVSSGQLYVAKAGIPHTVDTGSFGILVIIDLPETDVV
ncbi:MULTISPECIES: cupin domain-containing protein [Klebsiella]|jgi:Mannose-6-phosphate isomerase|uniref:Cupin domain-containing protein n=1 Tax=Klebsiella aerogenes TaxID=548 RepID=A0AAP9QZJ1_KLEAE|nr:MULTISPECIES: cupin domain-containing protein [Klebsiella]EIV2084416.1 cupin domain-containing protein [Klebsiella aerogenes]EIW9212657.1 cupin domain-containing protein [Klebsiella aerogenes]EIW9476859.1 cupin domain-containing protein [Klebsiella aerogenes]EIW9497062.1 cupin domain-containing protein [Klebsiella aerogenes]EKM7511079.1 cupin domain-containing protein [Klebsiella aerogenes]